MSRRLWRQRITLLAIPSAAGSSPWKACLSLRSLVLAAAAWTALSLLVLALALRLAGYGMLKADNLSLRSRLEALSAEMSRSRAELEAAREADQEIRVLLRQSLPAAHPLPRSDRAPLPQLAAAGPAGSGGGGPADRRSLLQSYLQASPAAGADPLRRDIREIGRMSRERLASCQEIAAHLAWRRRLFKAMPAGWPAPGRLTSRYGRRLSPLRGDDESGDREFHPGVDIAGGKGSPIRATAEGTVVRARWSGGYGRLVLLRHDLGYATLYGHASRLLVKEGEKVGRAQVIAAMGSTGRSTGSHVHYEVWFNGRTVDPKRFLAAPVP
ncbi:MAG: M23 family metallopeptidase [Elusimicrobia bacterium]|nr:M23 family metallopeptidase [Elusimicrobiota bacterium]